MNKINALIILITIPMLSFGQANYKSELSNALELLKSNNVATSYKKLKVLENKIPKGDSLYAPALWYCANTAGQLERTFRLNEKFNKSLVYGKEALKYIRDGKSLFNEDFAKREYFMVKNIVVSYFGLRDIKNGKIWKEKMYAAQKKGQLPDGIDKYFNFDFFTIDNKNIWGYEWFEELPENRFSRSFTKIVYYVYSTDENGADKEQLYRLHVLMYHGEGENFDYILDKKYTDNKKEISGSMFSFRYKKDIDYEKLRKDVTKIVKENIQADTKRTMYKKKDGKVNVDVELK